MPLRRERLLLRLCLLLAAGAFLAGIDWGLPSRAGDAYLFGTTQPWTGAQIVAITEASAAAKGADDPDRGADVDANPRAVSTQPVRINPENDLTARAEIVRRYRLFSHQPDEMITFMALRKMRPAELNFDPHLYQYGGLWIYPVALCLKASSALRLVELRSGDATAYYLDHPEAFARFYIVARLYVVAWALVGVWAVFAIVRRISGSAWAAAGAAVCFALMPVVVNMAHEAKPHLPGMVLVLLAVLGGARYVETGKLSYAIAAGVMCGCALSMVLSTLPAFVILPLMVLLRRQSWGDRVRVCVFCGLVGVVVYGVANPYVVYHLLRGGNNALASNMANSSAFYHFGQVGEGIANVARLTVAGASPAVTVVGGLAAIMLAVRAVRYRRQTTGGEMRPRAHGLLLGAPAVLTAVQASLVAAGKPGEFGRFLLLTDVFLAIETFVLLEWISRWRWSADNAEHPEPPAERNRAATLVLATLGVTIVAVTGYFGAAYVRGFIADRSQPTSRLAAAGEIEALRSGGAKRLLIAAEPAPYAVPPVNLFDWPVMLLPRGSRPEEFALPGDVFVEVQEGETAISWAEKRFLVRRFGS